MSSLRVEPFADWILAAKTHKMQTMRSMVHQTHLAGAVAAAAALVGCGSHHGPRPSAAHSPEAGRSSTPPPAVVAPSSTQVSGSAPPPNSDAGSRAATAQVSAARPVARAFFNSYVAYLYGRLPARDVVSVDGTLRWQLEHGRSNITQGERASRPRITHLSVATAGPPVSVVTIAVVDGGVQLARLSATLEPYHRTWRVVAIGP